jgi:hypothetical protein
MEFEEYVVQRVLSKKGNKYPEDALRRILEDVPAELQGCFHQSRRKSKPVEATVPLFLCKSQLAYTTHYYTQVVPYMYDTVNVLTTRPTN